MYLNIKKDALKETQWLGVLSTILRHSYVLNPPFLAPLDTIHQNLSAHAGTGLRVGMIVVLI
ncbi:hypothetical protein M426DRAFT_194910 [Hypoxylon sp. CI-4A]|nr:hypothetical protein M426DRAFT_194910 [Hypoxylon sp. CI-4A]